MPATTHPIADLIALAGKSRGALEAGGPSGTPPVSGTRLPGGGSGREYYRLQPGAGKSVSGIIGVIAGDSQEAETFLALTRHLAGRDIPVPRILGEDPARGLYLLEDLGERTLADRLARWRLNPKKETRSVSALESVVRWLPVIQVRGGEGIEAVLPADVGELDGQVFRADVERFLAHCLPRFLPQAPPMEGAPRADLEKLLERVDSLPRSHFCYRDFQTRNIMWVERDGTEGPVFLDYQSGRRGPLAYDLASLLYSSDTHAGEDLREWLMGVYLEALAECGVKVEREDFLAGFYPLLLLRRLQALGAFAEFATTRKLPGYEERIPPALAELRALLELGRFHFGLPALEKWLGDIVRTRD